MPNYNKTACRLFDSLSMENNIKIQHAMNGGEIYIKELGYWVDGYDIENNIVYEFDEKHHKQQKEKDLMRQNEIINFLNCKFVRIDNEYNISTFNSKNYSKSKGKLILSNSNNCRTKTNEQFIKECLKIH